MPVPRNTLNPEERRAVLDDPQLLLERSDLTDTEKVEILQNLCHDERLRAIANEEGMGGGRESHLARLHRALEHFENS